MGKQHWVPKINGAGDANIFQALTCSSSLLPALSQDHYLIQPSSISKRQDTSRSSVYHQRTLSLRIFQSPREGPLADQRGLHCHFGLIN